MNDAFYLRVYMSQRSKYGLTRSNGSGISKDCKQGISHG